MSKIIGIDLGTTNSVVAVLNADGRPEVVVNEEGDRLTPSVIAFEKSGRVLVGALARRQAIANPEGTVYSVKRFMGRRFDEVGEEELRLPYRPVRRDDGAVVVKISDQEFTAPQLSSKVLMQLRRAAEQFLGESVTEAVVTVPAYFDDRQRQATREAGELAGLQVKRIVNEPTAAALAYGLDKKKDEVIAVYDFGGGTFDISILHVQEGLIEVIATNGDTHLGGDDVDVLVMNFLVAKFEAESGLQVGKSKTMFQRFREASEQAKIELSAMQETEVNLPFLATKDGEPVHFLCTLTRAEFEAMIAPLVGKTLEACQRALSDAETKLDEIDEVVMVGGSTRIPAVLVAVEKFFGRKSHTGVNPDEVVALGAAIQGDVLSGGTQDMLLLDVTPLTLGVETVGGQVTPIIRRNARVPTEASMLFTTSADGETEVELHIVQGERELARDNRTLGRFLIQGIAEASRGVPRIKVTFALNASGTLDVSAYDDVSGRSYLAARVAAGSESDLDVHHMIVESESREAQNRQRRREVEAFLAAKPEQPAPSA